MSHIAHIISEISRCGVRYRNEQMKALGLGSRHVGYLLEISAEPGISQNCLSQRIGIDKSNVARQVALLEEKGFITCAPSPKDKRVTKLYPTERTLEVLPKINAMLAAWEDYLTRDLPESDKERLTTLLTRLRDRAGTWTEDDQIAEA